ncbi:MAG: hypothetical protein R3F56_01275 [Planctomycetota bacterium]
MSHPVMFTAGALALAISLPVSTQSLQTQSPASLSPRTMPLPPVIGDAQRGDSVLLLAAGSHADALVPGVGSLQLDPASLASLRGFAGFGPGLVPFLQAMPTGTFSYQHLVQQADAVALSRLAEVSLHAEFAQRDDEAKCARRAARHVEAVGGTLAPGWAHASLVGPARAMYRPDVRGVAYYEFAVQPEGFVVVSTGEHDHPIAHWNDLGSPIGSELERTAAAHGDTPTKLFKLDALCYVAVDAGGRMVANVGSMPAKLVPDPNAQGGFRFDPWSSMVELQTGFVAAYKPMIENLRMRAALAWEAERVAEAAVGPQDDWSPWVYSWAGTHADQRLYDQFSCCGCVTGCGATAWAMLFGWIDLKASQNDPRWRYRTGFYRTNGSVTGSAATIAPRYLDTGVRNMISEIRGHIDTFCAFGSGATFPWDMDEASEYMRTRTPGRISTHYSTVGIHWDDLRDRAIDEIVQNRTPAIIGTGWLSHYPLAYGYAVRYRDVTSFFTRVRVYSRWFYVNQGWGGSGNGWVEASTWFAGQVMPS